MSEEELELLITIDDPGELPEEDVFHHLHGQGRLDLHFVKVQLDQQTKGECSPTFRRTNRMNNSFMR